MLCWREQQPFEARVVRHGTRPEIAAKLPFQVIVATNLDSLDSLSVFVSTVLPPDWKEQW